MSDDALASLPLELVEKIDEVAERFEEACRAGSAPRIEEFLSGMDADVRAPLLRELLEIEAHYRPGSQAPREAYARLASLGEWAVSVLDEFLRPAFSVKLTVTAGPHKGRCDTFDTHDTFLVGRSAQARLSLPEDEYFSRAHFLIEINPPLCRLLDLRSKNGVFVNGTKVAKSIDLQDGDEIRGGRSSLKISITRPADVSLTRTAEPPQTPPVASHDDRPEAPASAPAPAKVDRAQRPAIPGYRLLAELGEGGMGVVYLAERQVGGERVALKTIRPAVEPTEATLGRFRREVEVLKRLHHPHIIALRDHGEANGLLYFAMEHVNGKDSAALLRAERQLPVDRAVRLVRQVLDALAHAHGLGFVHRDVKPSNILVAAVAAGHDVAKLADFGLARTYQASQMSGLTLAGQAGGTPAFMPPEQIVDFRTARPAADQYAAAASLLPAERWARDLEERIAAGVDRLMKKIN